MKFKDFIKTHQQKIVLVIGYVLVASIAFGLGQVSVGKFQKSKDTDQTSNLPVNYNANATGAQTVSSTSDTCQGKIKGSSSMIYHMPGGAFYDKTTNPIKCFDTEAEAKAAGFKKSSR